MFFSDSSKSRKAFPYQPDGLVLKSFTSWPEFYIQIFNRCSLGIFEVEDLEVKILWDGEKQKFLSVAF